MLTHIHLQNFAIVDELNLDFETGLNVLTGETGAGKSIWVDAVALALGQRADNTVIQTAKPKAAISLCFNIQNNAAAKVWLAAHDMNLDEECIIRRVINRSGPTRCTINGTPFPLHALRDFANALIHIHSQHDNHALLARDIQRQVLDQLANADDLIQGIMDIFHHWQTINHELERLHSKAAEREDTLALLKYQLDEIEALTIQANEWDTLTKEHQKLHQANNLIHALNQAMSLTMNEDGGSASQLLQQAIFHIESIQTEEPQLNTAKELLNTASIYLQEASNELSQYREHLDLSPEHLADVEARLTLIHDLARKHHVNPECLNEVAISLGKKVDDLENYELRVAALTSEQQRALSHYQKLAKELTEKRVLAARKLNSAITKQMQNLGMKGGKFAVQLTPITATISPTGNEHITFMVCTNPGQDLHPMTKIVSGGELSRISLALQVLTAQHKQLPTLIFDEIDVGIGGKTASTVGDLLRKLGNKAQVLCITHLPQVAAKGHHHFNAEKQSSKTKTQTQITKLTSKSRIKEIARMLSGDSITEEILTHAKNMLAT